MKKLLFFPSRNALKAIGVFLFLFFTFNASAQIPTCTEGCTAKDIKIVTSFLTFYAPGEANDGQVIDQNFPCNAGETVSAKLNVTLNTNSPRKGLTLYGYVLEAGGTPVAIGECFPIEFTKEITNVTVRFSNPIQWTCGANVELKDILIAWGTGNSQWCTSAAPQCPGTSSKCWKQGPAEYIPVVNFPCTSPSITAQPGNQTKCAGESASFSFTFNQGSPEATIQWQVSTNNGSTWSNLSNAAPYSGVTTTTLSISSTTVGMNGYRYKAVLTNNTENNQCGTETNGSATLTVYGIPGAPNVTYNAPACDQTTFSVTVTNVTNGATYTIKDKNGANIPGVSPGNSVLAPNTNNITFSNIPAGSGYQVSVTANGCQSSGTAQCPAVSPAPPEVAQLASKEVLVEMPSNDPDVKAYPNPFRTAVTFKLVSPVSGRASLDVYNASGQRIGNAFNGVLQANVPVTTEFRMAQPTQGMLFYRMTMDGRAATGKLMSIR